MVDLTTERGVDISFFLEVVLLPFFLIVGVVGSDVNFPDGNSKD